MNNDCNASPIGCNELSSNVFSLDGDNLLINIDNLSPTVVSGYLEATTLGGVKAYKKLEAEEQRGPCSYTMEKLILEPIVLPYE